MNRRWFLSTITAGLAAAALDPERLLWVPNHKTIFIPPPPRLMTLEEFLRSPPDWRIARIVNILSADLYAIEMPYPRGRVNTAPWAVKPKPFQTLSTSHHH